MWNTVFKTMVSNYWQRQIWLQIEVILIVLLYHLEERMSRILQWVTKLLWPFSTDGNSLLFTFADSRAAKHCRSMLSIVMFSCSKSFHLLMGCSYQVFPHGLNVLSMFSEAFRRSLEPFDELRLWPSLSIPCKSLVFSVVVYSILVLWFKLSSHQFPGTWVFFLQQVVLLGLESESRGDSVICKGIKCSFNLIF